MSSPLSLPVNILGGFVTSGVILLMTGMYMKEWDPEMFTIVGIFYLVFLISVSLNEALFKLLHRSF
jgi:hypothetical protein